MESSSENSFAWTDTSSDSFNSISMAADNLNDKSNDNCNLHTEYVKKRNGKKSLSKTLPNNESGDEEIETDIKEEKKKVIKLEPESDVDIPKKRKTSKHSEINGNQNDLRDSVAYDETFLNMKVKQEESSTKHKQKKHKSQSRIDSTTLTKLKSSEINFSNEVSDGNVTLKQETDNYTEIIKTKKKKKKSKERFVNDDQNLGINDEMYKNETIADKTDIESNNVNHADSSMGDSITLQEGNEESDCGEISAIKCDDDHNHHTVSFIKKNIDKNKTKIKCDASLNNMTISSTQKQANNNIEVQDSNKKSEVIKHRTQRISDRIRFEDDDDTNIESSQSVHESDYESSKKSTKLKQFVGRNSNLKIISHQFNNKSTLTLDDEIWVLKCPKEIDIQDFNKTTLNIQGKCKIKVGGQTYDVSAEEEQSDTVSLLTIEHSKYKIRNLALSGVIHLRKRIPKAHFRDDNIMVNNQSNFIPLPETKCRHPLFGSNYKKALKIPTVIAERLNVQDSEEPSMKTEKRKKKKKKDRNTSKQTETQVQNEHSMKLEPAVEISEKKKKKRKIVDDEGPVSKKMKRIKHDPESAEAWESEKAIEENLFNF